MAEEREVKDLCPECNEYAWHTMMDTRDMSRNWTMECKCIDCGTTWKVRFHIEAEGGTWGFKAREDAIRRSKLYGQKDTPV